MRPIKNFEEILPLAADWAGRVHAEKAQTWSDGRPYLDHLVAVENVLIRFGFNDPADPIHQNLRIAAYCHDLVEDTRIPIETVRGLQGPDVAILVQAVTNEPGPNRAARHLATYPKIRATPWATVLKLADRIANVEESIRTGSRHLDMYVKEASAFREALFTEGGPEAKLWAHLDQLIEDARPKAVAITRETALTFTPWVPQEPTSPWIV